MKLKRIIAAAIIVPLAVLLVAFIIANREMMSVRLNPFVDDGQGFEARAPAFVFLFVFLGLGVVVGSIATWIGQHKYRKKARRFDEGMDAI